MSDLFTKAFENSPVDWINAVFAGIIGLLLVVAYEEWLRKPKLEYGGVIKVKVSFGYLYKLRLKIPKRRFLLKVRHPGQAQLKISWCGNNVFAKWDENPTPIKADWLYSNKDWGMVAREFIPEAVPSTYFNNLFAGEEYLVPVIHEDEAGNRSVFSGWWFGRHLGYGDPRVGSTNLQISFSLNAANLEWEKSLKLEEIVQETKA